MGAVCSMLARAATDSNPDMKLKVATFAGSISSEIPDRTGAYMKLTIESLIANLQH